MIRQLAGLLTAGRLLFLTPLCEEIIIPVEIDNGGQAMMSAMQESSPMPDQPLLVLKDQETGSYSLSFTEQGCWTYRIEQLPEKDRITDSTVYLLKVETDDSGRIIYILLNRSDSDEKAESVHFVSRLIPSKIPDTSDPGLKGYFLTSAFSLLLCVIILKAGGGNNEQM